eukprot:jgi/Mesen1/1223/ME000129S00319
MDQCQVSLPALTGVMLERFNLGGTELPVVLMTRTTSAIAADGLLLIDTSANFAISPAVYVLALSINTGALVWQTQADSHVAAILTMGGTVYGSSYYVGVSSIEELLSRTVAGFECCSVVGSALAIDIPTGIILWRMNSCPGPINCESAGKWAMSFYAFHFSYYSTNSCSDTIGAG